MRTKIAHKKQIAVRTCGGCGCDFDMVLLINGCDSECAPASTIDSVVIIDHTNHDKCVEVFGVAVAAL